MGTTPEKLIRVWLAAVGQSENTTGPRRDKVVLAGEFLWKTGRLGPKGVPKEIMEGELTPQDRKVISDKYKDLLDALRGFDFTNDVKVVNRLEDKVYVQFVKKHLGNWFTNTGMTEDDCGLATGFRNRKLFRPSGSVCALQGTAEGIRDYWTADKLFKWLDLQKKWDVLVAQAKRRGKPKLTEDHYEALKKRLGDLTRGGGTQYYVIDPHQMNALS